LLVAGLGCALPLACDRKEARAQALPALGTIKPFGLKNQEGAEVDQESLRGTVWVAAFFFSRCPTVCPRIMKRMARLQNSAKAKNIPVRLVGFSVDPEFDTPQVLKAYGERYGADFKRWSLLTGASETIQKTVTDSFKIGLEGEIDESKQHLGITHGSHLVLVDQALTIRGYYRTSDERKMQELLLHAADLTAS
jgi:protein SCO1/2